MTQTCHLTAEYAKSSANIMRICCPKGARSRYIAVLSVKSLLLWKTQTLLLFKTADCVQKYDRFDGYN